MTITPAAANDLLLSCLSSDNATVASITGGSLTIDQHTEVTANGEAGVIAHEIAPNTTAISWNYSLTGGEDGAAFLVGAAPSSPTFKASPARVVVY